MSDGELKGEDLSEYNRQHQVLPPMWSNTLDEGVAERDDPYDEMRAVALGLKDSEIDEFLERVFNETEVKQAGRNRNLRYM